MADLFADPYLRSMFDADQYYPQTPSKQSPPTKTKGGYVDGVYYPNIDAWNIAQDKQAAANDVNGLLGGPNSPSAIAVPPPSPIMGPGQLPEPPVLSQTGADGVTFNQVDRPLGGIGGGALSATPGASPGVLSPLPPAREVGYAPGAGDPRGLIPYIREEAMKNGVDPDIAVKVARSEGLGTFLGDHGKSGGAFQLFTGGGMGNEFTRDTGLDPLDPKNEKATIAYAMSRVGQTGWGPWHGAARVGIGNRDGLPPLGNKRDQVSLAVPDPQSSPAPQVPLGGSGGGVMPQATPVAGNPLAAALGGSGGTGSDLAQLLQLARQSQRPNPSKMLASMAAGFLGGKGPAASLAGGFAGMANAMPSGKGTTDLDLLVKLAGLQHTATSEKRQNFEALVKAGVPAKTAAAATGFNLPGLDQSTSGLTGDEFLKTLEPGEAAQIKGIVDGRIQLSPRVMATPQGKAMLDKITQFDPDFDQTNYNKRFKTRQSFTSGQDANNLTALNTAIGHADTALKAAEALNNTSLPAYNSVANFLAQNTGDPRVQQFDVARNALASELTRVFRGSGGALADVEAWKKDLNAASSPSQLRAAIGQAVNLMGSRISSMAHKYREGMGTEKASLLELMDPHAAQILATLPNGADVLRSIGAKVPDAAAIATRAAPSPSSAPLNLPKSGVTSTGVKWKLINP